MVQIFAATFFFFFQAEDGIRDYKVTGVQTCALPIYFAGSARLAREIATPIQIGENFMGPEQMAQALAAGACDFVMPDAQRIGGVTGWMRAAALAQGAGVEMSSHLFPEASCHLLAATPTCHWLEFVDWAAPVLQDPVQVKDGQVLIPERPGLGMTWDEKAVKRFAV